MDQPAKKSPWPRRLKRLALIVGGLVGLLAAWVLFFPVPLGWAARIGLHRALPANGPLQVEVDVVTFHWRWGQPTLLVSAEKVVASSQARPLLTVREIALELPKAGLWKGFYAPAQIVIADPNLTLDQTPTGALALLAPPPPVYAACLQDAPHADGVEDAPAPRADGIRTAPDGPNPSRAGDRGDADPLAALRRRGALTVEHRDHADRVHDPGLGPRRGWRGLAPRRRPRPARGD